MQGGCARRNLYTASILIMLIAAPPPPSLPCARALNARLTVHELLRVVSGTPEAWAAVERRRVREHVGELAVAVRGLEDALEAATHRRISLPAPNVPRAPAAAAAVAALVTAIGDVEGAVEHLHEHVERC